MFQLYRGENKLNFPWDDDEVRFVLDQQSSWILIVLANWNNNPWIDMSLHSDPLS